MNQETLQAYIRQRLTELEKGKDLKEITLNGWLSFGVDSRDFSHLPAWNELVKKKKLMRRMVWVNAFSVSAIAVLIIGDFADKFEKSWLLAIAYFIVITAAIMFFDVIWSFYSVFYHFRQTEREIRKLIYQDLLQRMEEGEPR